jgi:hypothetical protein
MWFQLAERKATTLEFSRSAIAKPAEERCGHTRSIQVTSRACHSVGKEQLLQLPLVQRCMRPETFYVELVERRRVAVDAHVTHSPCAEEANNLVTAHASTGGKRMEESKFMAQV